MNIEAKITSTTKAIEWLQGCAINYGMAVEQKNQANLKDALTKLDNAQVAVQKCLATFKSE